MICGSPEHFWRQCPDRHSKGKSAPKGKGKKGGGAFWLTDAWHGWGPDRQLGCFFKEAKEVGFVRSKWGPCVLYLQTNGRYNGCLRLAVDDVAGGGDVV